MSTRGSRRARILSLVVAALAVTGVWAPSPSAAASDITLSPGDDVFSVIKALRPGDTVRLRPGRYETGYLRFYTGITLTPGTSTAPITVTAADPANPPLLVGGLSFKGANYWRISRLRVQATEPGFPAFSMTNGIGWSVSGSEFFGARQTNAYANVAIDGSANEPRGFDFRGNCIHDAAYSTRTEATDHNIYVKFSGSRYTNGVITRNLIWGAPHGANIKIGNGGAYAAPGPWNVRVAFNTIVNGGSQVLLHGDVKGNQVYGNILVNATRKFSQATMTTQVAGHDVVGLANSVDHTYAYRSTNVVYDNLHHVVVGSDNRLRADPVFASPGACNGWRPTTAAAKAYGATGTGLWTR